MVMYIRNNDAVIFYIVEREQGGKILYLRRNRQSLSNPKSKVAVTPRLLNRGDTNQIFDIIYDNHVWKARCITAGVKHNTNWLGHTTQGQEGEYYAQLELQRKVASCTG